MSQLISLAQSDSSVGTAGLGFRIVKFIFREFTFYVEIYVWFIEETDDYPDLSLAQQFIRV